MNKRAVSPLVATILLIAFAMALGIIVMNVGASYIALEEDESVEKVSVLDIIDKCVSAGAITADERDILTDSVK